MANAIDTVLNVLSGKEKPTVETVVVLDQKTMTASAITWGVVIAILIILWAIARKFTNP